MLPRDTTLEAARVQFSVLRRLGTVGRAKMSFALSDRLRTTLDAGVRWRHPEYTDEMVRLAVLRITLGERLFREAFPGQNVKV